MKSLKQTVNTLMSLSLVLGLSTSAAASQFQQTVQTDFQRWRASSSGLNQLKKNIESGASPEIYVPLFCQQAPNSRSLKLKKVEVLEEKAFKDLDQNDFLREAVWLKVKMLMDNQDSTPQSCESIYYLKYVYDKGYQLDQGNITPDKTPRWLLNSFRFSQERIFTFRAKTVDPDIQEQLVENLNQRVSYFLNNYSHHRFEYVNFRTIDSETHITISMPPFYNLPQKFVKVLTENHTLEFKFKNDKNEWVKSHVSGKDLQDARANIFPNDKEWIIEFDLNGQGARKFAELTTRIKGEVLGIFIDGKLITAPVVNSPITGGSGYINGDFSPEEAKKLAHQLNTQPFIKPLYFQKEKTINLVLDLDSLAVPPPHFYKTVKAQLLQRLKKEKNEFSPDLESVLSSVRVNMHTLQIIVETYALDWGGQYPETVEHLYHEATTANYPYWKDFINPFTHLSGNGLSYANEGDKALKGILTYQVNKSKDSYKIWGYDQFGEKLKTHEGIPLILSNS